MPGSHLRALADRFLALPRIVRLILVNAAAGAVLGAGIGTALLALDGLGLGTLIASSGEPWLAATMFLSGMASTFGSLYAASAIMLDKGGEP